ncbi:MAG: mandelate racemase [Rhodospirillaceae bacterium]|jgi:L-Ala-D/L-Glu epimerase|nr:mandelate racemase [Rhodospirillaceae bacterium]
MTDDPQIDRLMLYRVQVPLTIPYKLAFGPVEAFDMVLVEAVLGNGETGWGEATVLTGYTEETIAQAWVTANDIAAKVVGRDFSDTKSAAMRCHADAPFTTTAFVTAMEMATRHPVLATDNERRTPLLAIINATETGALTDEIEARIADGYATLKIKVGFDLAADMKRLEFIQDRTAARVALRVDANQGYTQAEGATFVGGIDPTGIELVEQPCSAGDWEAAVAVAQVARGNGVPFMLDESIYGLDDVDRAADLKCADIIKLKLMKAGGLDALASGIGHIRSRGMQPVLGNGVAGDIGCWMEACVGAEMVDNAGEMNGFLKPVQRLFEVPMRLDSGELVLEADGEVVPDRDAIAAHTQETREYNRHE